jgi:beta-glucosidase/6-phospho-beta-glucosidase/beta-galactosidase
VSYGEAADNLFAFIGRHGMEPHVTLIWFVHPQWFQELGAFSKEENIPIFVDWCKTAFKLFGAPGLTLCAVFNSTGNHPEVL